MTTQYASDLHLEFPKNREYIKAHPIEPVGDIMLLGGDIVPFREMEKHKDFFDYLSDHFEKTYWIPGNHEYYGFDLAEKCGTFNEAIRENLFLLNNTSVVYQDVKLIFSTLWSQIDTENASVIHQELNDFHRIKYKAAPLSVKHFNGIHKESLHFVERELSMSQHPKKVMVTHHVPTLRNYPLQYLKSPLNKAFAIELDDLIARTQPAYWVYGHHHYNTHDFSIGNTRLLTNQLGYLDNDENYNFYNNKTFSIE